MPNMPNQKLRLLQLLRILFEKTDGERGLTTQQIIEELAYRGVEAERKALYRDMQAMRDMGLEVVQRGGREWYLATRPLDLQEMIMLVDAVQSSPFLTEEMTDSLIARIQGLASEGQREMLARRVEVPGRVKMQNADALANVDLIQQALRQRRMLEFRYFHYDVTKQRVLNGDGAVYSTAPVSLVYADELYYMVGYMERWAGKEGCQPFTPYRVDRMVDVRVTDEDAPRDRRIAEWHSGDNLAPGFGVFAAEKVPVVLEFDQSAMNPIVDKFGIDAVVFEKEGDRAQAHVKAPLSPQFFGWLMELGPVVRIVHPKSAAETYQRRLSQVQRMYTGGYRILSEAARGCVTQGQYLQLVEDLEAALAARAEEAGDGGFSCEWDFIQFAADFAEGRLADLGVDDGMPKEMPEPRMVGGKMRTPIPSIEIGQYVAYGQALGEALIAVEPRKWAAREAEAGFLDTAERYCETRSGQFTMVRPPALRTWTGVEHTRRRQWKLSDSSLFEIWTEKGESGYARHCKLVAPEIGLSELELEPWLGLDPTGPMKAAAKMWLRIAYRFS